jgi:methylated-DNA-protein-cysteine methyltransferase related protein
VSSPLSWALVASPQKRPRPFLTHTHIRITALKFLNPGSDVPWHRVVSSSGAISSRGPGTSGAEHQKDALEAEGVEVAVGRTGEFRVDFGAWGWFPEVGTVDIGVALHEEAEEDAPAADEAQ